MSEGSGAAGTPPGKGDEGTGTPPAKGEGNPEAVQAAIDAVVARERKRADREMQALKDQLADLQAKLDSKRKPDEGDEAFKAKVAEARRPLEDQVAALGKALTARESKIVRAELKAAAADLSVDADEVAERLAGAVRFTDAGELEVVDADGKPRYGAKGPMTVVELVTGYLASKPYLAKSKMPSGMGLGTPGTPNPGDLRAQIAAAEAKGDFATAGALKVQMLKQVAP